MNIVRWVLALLLAAFFLYMAHFKFLPGVNAVFSTLAERSGIAAFEPFGRFGTGALEILTGILLVLPATRRQGAMLGLLILIGAIVFHFSPWLGIDVPGIGPSLFYTALAGLALNLVVLVLESTGASTVTRDDHG